MRKFHIKVNGNTYEVEVEEVENRIQSTPVVKSTPVTSAPKEPVKIQKDISKPTGSQKGTSVVAPMPGTILDIRMKEGDEVQKNQVLMILEAMKMENEIFSPIDGRIVSIHTTKGGIVKASDLLVVIE